MEKAEPDQSSFLRVSEYPQLVHILGTDNPKLVRIGGYWTTGSSPHWRVYCTHS